MGSSIRRSSAGRVVALGLAALLLAAEAPAATFEVDGTPDTVDASPGEGICADVAGLCTLRAAIMETNALPGADVVHLPSGHFVLSLPGQGEDGAASGDLDLTGELTVRGEGADRTTIDADGLDRAIDVSGVVSIEGVTITGGRDLGGVRARGLQGLLARLVLDSVSVRDNEASGAGDGFFAAGGIAIEFGSLSMRHTTVSGNRGDFGGIAVFGTASIVNSTISTNAGRCRDCPLVPGCTPGGAGALAAVAGTVVIRNAAIVDNDCPTEGGGDGWALNAGSGGLFSGEIHLGSSVLAGSLCEFAYTSDGHNLVAGFDCAFSDPTDLYGLDPLLGPLQDNGGPTPTHKLLPGSPAINAIPIEDCTYDDDGDPATPEVPVATDQRGVRRPHGGRCDIGAYERNSCGLGAELAVLLPLLGALRRGGRTCGLGANLAPLMTAYRARENAIASGGVR